MFRWGPRFPVTGVIVLRQSLERNGAPPTEAHTLTCIAVWLGGRGNGGDGASMGGRHPY